MTLRDKILDAARALARETPVDQITLADVAKAVGVHWTTVRRHIGSRTELKALLAREQVGGAENPDTRTRILAAAARVFARQGYEGASLDLVSAEAGLTKGAVYWHFASKSDLFLALMQTNVRSQLAGLPAEAEGILQSQAPDQALAAWLAAQFGRCRKDPNQGRLFFEFVASSREPEIQAQLAAVIREMVEGSAAVIRGMQASRLLAEDLDPYVMAVFIQAFLNGMNLAAMIDPEGVRLEEWAAQLARILWHGIGTQG